MATRERAVDRGTRTARGSLLRDARAWDGLVARTGWRFGVEAETQPRDAQALIRRLRLKERDGRVDGVILVLPDTRHVRAFVRSAAPELDAALPARGAMVLAELRRGSRPDDSAVIVLKRSFAARTTNDG